MDDVLVVLYALFPPFMVFGKLLVRFVYIVISEAMVNNDVLGNTHNISRLRYERQF